MGSTHNTWSFCPDYICSPIQGVLPPHQSRQPAHLLPFSSFGDESDTPVHAVLQTHFPAFQVTLERPLLITSLTSGCGGTWAPSVSGLQKLKQLHFGSLAYKHRTRYVCAKKLLETTAGWRKKQMPDSLYMEQCQAKRKVCAFDRSEAKLWRRKLCVKVATFFC
jgi:hypothetical protein